MNFESPGYILIGDVFEYPEWTSLEQAYDKVEREDYDSFGINFCLLNSKDVVFDKLSLVAENETKSISLIVGEEGFIDFESSKVNRSELISFANFNQALSSQISVKAWRIAQTGFDHDIDRGFIRYIAGSDDYPIDDIDKTISWYEGEYFNR